MAVPRDQRQPSFKPSMQQFYALVVVFVLYGIGFGYYAGIQPIMEWRFFSWHPFLMTLGMITLPGVASVTKKMGGYTNTKMHGILAWLGIFCMLAGWYAIYLNKERNGAQHLTSTHATVGVFVMCNMIGLGLAGGVVLHPDFGLDKTNKTVRLAHKLGARLILVLSWFTAVLGLYQLVSESYMKLMIYAAPLIALAPYSIM